MHRDLKEAWRTWGQTSRAEAGACAVAHAWWQERPGGPRGRQGRHAGWARGRGEGARSCRISRPPEKPLSTLRQAAAPTYLRKTAAADGLAEETRSPAVRTQKTWRGARDGSSALHRGPR